MKFYDLSRRERRKLKNQFDKTILGANLKSTTFLFIIISVLYLISPLILCIFRGFDAISIAGMLTFFGFFLVFSGLIYIMLMLRYVLLKEFYDDKQIEKEKEDK